MNALVGFSVVVSVLSNSYRPGTKCPPAKVPNNFDMDEFDGEWYVMRRTLTTSRCIAIKYLLVEEGEYELEEISVPDSTINASAATRRKNNRRAVEQKVGKLSILNVNKRKSAFKQPPVMQLEYPTSVYGPTTHMVLDTDYKYAVVFLCRELPFAHMLSISILSRRRKMPDKYYKQALDILRANNLSASDISVIDQEDCSSVPTARSAGNVFDVTGNSFCFESIHEAFLWTGTWIADGVSYFVTHSRKMLKRFTQHLITIG